MIDSLESFEKEAAEFYADTGYLAPGKSEPCDAGQYDFDRNEVRRLMKMAWDKGRVRRAPDPLAEAREAVIVAAEMLVNHKGSQDEYEALERNLVEATDRLAAAARSAK